MKMNSTSIYIIPINSSCGDFRARKDQSRERGQRN